MTRQKTAKVIADPNGESTRARLATINDGQEVAFSGGLANKAAAVAELKEALVEEVEKRADERDTHLCGVLEKQMEELREELTAAYEKALDARKLSGAPEMGTKESQWSLFRSVRAIATKDWTEAELEREVFDAMREKALSMGVDSAGGFIVPENYTAQIIEKLEQENPLIQMGARVIPGITGSPLILPKQTGSATAFYTGEGAQISKTQQTIGQLEFVPRTLAAITELNNVLRENANPDVEAFVFDDLRKQFDNAITTYGLLGDGTGAQPIGLINEQGVPAVNLGTGNGGVSFDNLVQHLHQLMLGNAYRGRLGWILHPTLFVQIWQMKDATENLDPGGGDPTVPVNTQQLERRMIARGPADTLLGHPYATTTALPAPAGGGATSGIFGDWSQQLIPTWKTLELRASQEAGETWERDQTSVRALLRHDFGIRHAESFCISDNVGGS